MSNLTISIFGSKIFLEIINEIKLFSKFNIKYYEDLDLCIKEAKKQNLLVVFFIKKKNKIFFDNNTYNFPSILIVESSTAKNKFSNELKEQLNMPFTILLFYRKPGVIIIDRQGKILRRVYVNGVRRSIE